MKALILYVVYTTLPSPKRPLFKDYSNMTGEREKAEATPKMV